MFQLETIPPCPVAAFVKSLSPSPFSAPFRYWKVVIMLLQSFLFCSLNNPNSLRHSLDGGALPLDHLGVLPLDLLQQAEDLPVLGTPELDAAL